MTQPPAYDLDDSDVNPFRYAIERTIADLERRGYTTKEIADALVDSTDVYDYDERLLSRHYRYTDEDTESDSEWQ